jgi:hypothetical protein
MATHIEDHYEGLQVDLDGQEYIRCKFTNCQLTYRGSSRIRLEQCEIDEHCRLVPLAQAANTIVALTELFHTTLRRSLLRLLGLSDLG